MLTRCSTAGGGNVMMELSVEDTIPLCKQYVCPDKLDTYREDGDNDGCEANNDCDHQLDEEQRL